MIYLEGRFRVGRREPPTRAADHVRAHQRRRTASMILALLFPRILSSAKIKNKNHDQKRLFPMKYLELTVSITS